MGVLKWPDHRVLAEHELQRNAMGLKRLDIMLNKGGVEDVGEVQDRKGVA